MFFFQYIYQIENNIANNRLLFIAINRLFVKKSDSVNTFSSLRLRVIYVLWSMDYMQRSNFTFCHNFLFEYGQQVSDLLNSLLDHIFEK